MVNLIWTKKVIMINFFFHLLQPHLKLTQLLTKMNKNIIHSSKTAHIRYCTLKSLLPECGIETTAGLMMSHCFINSQDVSSDRLEPAAVQSDRAPYASLFCDITVDEKLMPLPISRLPGSSWTWNVLRYHFNIHYWRESISIL